MFCTKYKNRIKELESYEATYEARIENQRLIIDGLTKQNYDLTMDNKRISFANESQSRFITNLKTECIEKDEQVNRLQRIVNEREEGAQSEDNVDELKRTIEKQAGQIGRLEAFKRRIQEKKKPATNSKTKNKK